MRGGKNEGGGEEQQYLHGLRRRVAFFPFQLADGCNDEDQRRVTRLIPATADAADEFLVCAQS